MTIEEIKRLAELYSALAEGKIIQVKNIDNVWYDVKPETLNHIPEELAFRVKPKLKFDPKTLKPFDWVLVRDRDDTKWLCDYYSYTYNNRFICTGGMGWRYCIPYHKDTKHLVGTSEEAPEYYKYWED